MPSLAFPGGSRAARRHRRAPATPAPATQVAARHALAILSNAGRTSRGISRDSVYRAIRNWHGEYVGASDDDDSSPRAPMTERARQALVTALRAVAGKAGAAGARLDGIGRLARVAGLEELDAAILRIVALYKTNAAFEGLADAMMTRVFRGPPALRGEPGLFALLTGRGEAELAPRLRRGGTLAQAGLLLVEEGGNIRMLNRALAVASGEFSRDADVVDAILGSKLEAQLTLADFEHMRDDIARVRRILAGALASGEGAAVLFAGITGAGKTELAKALAASLRVPIFSIGQHDSAGNEPAPVERLAELALAQRLFANARGKRSAILLVDEAEDLYGGGGSGYADVLGDNFPDVLDGGFARAGSSRSRAYVHGLLEGGRVPMILTCNNKDGLGGTPFLRRMTAIVSFGVPTIDIRRRLVRNAAKAEGIAGIDDAHVETLARMPAGPAIARSALRAARLAGGDPEVAIWAAAGVDRAMRGAGRSVSGPALEAPASFDPALVSADVDLAAIAARLAAPGASREVSLLLSGPPGSGKSAFARWLAGLWGLPVLEKRYSDLGSKFVSETEARIAKAFAEAEFAGAMLVFDEADSLLRSRSGAQHSWEVSMVNEMLTAMERHKLPFVATTNMLDDMDPAAMRRFLVKARLGFLTLSQRKTAFASHYGCSPPTGLEDLDALTPADFALVARRAALEGFAGEPDRLLTALRSEQEAKPGKARRESIGFVG